jgi:bacteriocin biosynthesis cyclodehydratase domain-containing protein
MTETLIETDVARSRRLVLNPFVTVIRCTDDEVLYRHGSRSEYSRVLQDEGRRRILGRVLAAFAMPPGTEGWTAAEAAPGVADRDGVVEVVERLVEDGVLVPRDSALSEMYFQMRTGKAPTGLGAAVVGLLGLGTIGGQVARQLAGLGVGSVVGMDDREITARDQAFLRGALGIRADTGQSMAAAFAAAAEDAGLPNVDARPGSVGDLVATADLLEEVDLLVVALETFPPSLLHNVNDLAIAAEKPWLPVHADGSEVIVGPLVVPGRSPCYNEYEIQHEASRTLRREYLLYREELTRQPIGAAPQLLPPYAGIAASWTVTAVLPFLLEGSSFLVGRAVRVDFERLEVTNERVLRLPRCPACVCLRPDLRHPFL